MVRASNTRPAPSSAEQLQDLGIFRKTPDVVLRKDQLPVDLDIEDASASGDQLRGFADLTLNLGCQTGGLRFVVSTRAISDSNRHLDSFP